MRHYSLSIIYMGTIEERKVWMMEWPMLGISPKNAMAMVVVRMKMSKLKYPHVVIKYNYNAQ